MENEQKNVNDIDNIELIIWAFEKGYTLATSDFKDGVHIDFSETKKYFIKELSEFNKQKLTWVSSL